MVTGASVWAVLEQVLDPEIPLVSITELGMVRCVEVLGDTIRVGLSPTYSGCPATDAIAADVEAALRRHWPLEIDVYQVLTPPWTTDWINDAGKAKLLAGGIAPPSGTATTKDELLNRDTPVTCPRCGSASTRRVSEFGSTPCKSAHVCGACLEPFEAFKCL